MAKKKKPESMLTRQRRLLREQRARKAAAKKALEKAAKAPKQLPGKGKTTASSNRAKVQRGLRRDRLARKQLETFARGMKKTLKQSSATDKLKKAAKGTKGTTVRTAQGKGDLVKRTSNLPASQRVEKVKVKVDPPKQLSPAKTKTTPALPKGKTRLKGQPSARRAKAAARAARAAQGTSNPNVRKGQPAGAANRFYGADRVDKAVSRAQRSTLARKALKTLSGASRLLAGRDDGSGSALQAALLANAALDAARGSTAEERNKKKDDKPKSKVKVQTDNTTVTRKKSRDYQAEKKARETKAANPSLKPAGKVSAASSPEPKQPAPKKPTLREAAYAKDARNKEYDDLRKAGKIKKAEALGKKIAADARKKAPKNPFRVPQGKERKDRFSRDVAALKAMRSKKKKEPQSRALRAGYPGNRNY